MGAGLRRKRVHTLRVERKHRLDGDVHTLKTILLEHHLRHPLAIDLRVHWGLGEEHLAPAGVDSKFLVECVVPQQLHVFPVPYDAVLHRLCDLEIIAVLRGLVADHNILDDRGPDALLRAQNGATDDGGEYWA